MPDRPAVPPSEETAYPDHEFHAWVKIYRYEELLAERDLLVRRVAGLEITSEALRALPADMPLGEALNLIEHIKQAGRDLAESQAARRGAVQ